MATARSPRPLSPPEDEPALKKVRRHKVLTTAMNDDTPTATKTGAKKRGTTKKVTQKKAKKPVKTKRPVTIRVAAAKPAAEPDEPSEWLEPRGPRPARRSATERIDDPPPATGAELVERVSWAIERELNQIELIVGGHRVKPTQRTEAERRARTLASLTRTLSEVTRLRAQQQQRPDDDDDAMPRDLDEFRETLARRLERLIADRSQSPDEEPQLG